MLDICSRLRELSSKRAMMMTWRRRTKEEEDKEDDWVHRRAIKLVKVTKLTDNCIK